jgi:hypothetical protein
MRGVYTVLGICIASLVFATSIMPAIAFELDEYECLVEFETYDAEYDACVFEPVCESEQQCQEIELKYDTALDELEEFFEYDEDIGSDGQNEDFVEGESIATYEIRDMGLQLMDKGLPGDSEFPYAYAESLHKEIWGIIAHIVPQNTKNRIGTLLLETDGLDGTLAAVEIGEGSTSSWNVVIDVVDVFKENGKFRDKREFLQTLLHEFAHIMTLNETQVALVPELLGEEYDVDVYAGHEKTCATFFTGEGCAFPGAYIAEFVDLFWTPEMITEVRSIDDSEDLEEIDDLVSEFYNAHENEFLTEYAATNPGEDIAETWVLFVTQKESRSLSSIADKKLNFFYRFPELVARRDQIRTRLQQVIEGGIAEENETVESVEVRGTLETLAESQKMILKLLLTLIGVDETVVDKFLGL